MGKPQISTRPTGAWKQIKYSVSFNCHSITLSSFLMIYDPVLEHFDPVKTAINESVRILSSSQRRGRKKTLRGKLNKESCVNPKYTLSKSQN